MVLLAVQILMHVILINLLIMMMEVVFMILTHMTHWSQIVI